jgi:hypothetical protein
MFCTTLIVDKSKSILPSEFYLDGNRIVYSGDVPYVFSLVFEVNVAFSNKSIRLQITRNGFYHQKVVVCKSKLCPVVIQSHMLLNTNDTISISIQHSKKAGPISIRNPIVKIYKCV